MDTISLLPVIGILVLALLVVVLVGLRYGWLLLATPFVLVGLIDGVLGLVVAVERQDRTADPGDRRVGPVEAEEVDVDPRDRGDAERAGGRRPPAARNPSRAGTGAGGDGDESLVSETTKRPDTLDDVDDAVREQLRRLPRGPGVYLFRDARDEILGNRIYQQLSSAVAGSQEFTAIAKLYELDQEGDYDLLVLDTPPSRNALDFLDAPDRLTGFLEGRALRVFLAPTGLAARVVGRGTSVVSNPRAVPSAVILASGTSSRTASATASAGSMWPAVPPPATTTDRADFSPLTYDSLALRFVHSHRVWCGRSSDGRHGPIPVRVRLCAWVRRPPGRAPGASGYRHRQNGHGRRGRRPAGLHGAALPVL